MLKSNTNFCSLIITLRSDNHFQFRGNPGSMLRGAFGHGLKKAFCAMHHKDCKNCQVSNHCGYFEIFESEGKMESCIKQGFKYRPHPYVINYIISDEKITKITNNFVKEDNYQFLFFQITIFGDYIKYIPYFVYAFQLMGKFGLGKDRINFDLALVHDYFTLENVYDDQKLDMNKLKELDLKKYIDQRNPYRTLPGRSQRIKINFLSPARFVKKGKPLKTLDKQFLTQSINLRYGLMNQMYGTLNDIDSFSEDDFNIIYQDVKFNQWQRYSNRQKRKHIQEGLTGYITFESSSETFSKILYAMEIFNIGKNTSFGLGKVEVQHYED